MFGDVRNRSGSQSKSFIPEMLEMEAPQFASEVPKFWFTSHETSSYDPSPATHQQVADLPRLHPGILF